MDALRRLTATMVCLLCLLSALKWAGHAQVTAAQAGKSFIPEDPASDDPAVTNIQLSHQRGFYDGPFAVAIATETAGATIVYTLDGSTPAPGRGTIYAGPIPISRTTCLRAMAFKEDCQPTKVDTHTYIFPDDVMRQATNPATGAQVTPSGYPSIWPGGSYSGSVLADYQVDLEIVDHAAPSNRLEPADLEAVPTISLAFYRDDLFGAEGIYVNEDLTYRVSEAPEKVCSFEYIDPNTGRSAQANCALAMAGGVTGGGTSLQRWKSFKLSLRPRFKTQTDDGTPTGGPAKLDFGLFPDSPVERFNTVVLDAVLNHSWLHPGGDQRNTATYIQDQYVADLHNATGGHSPHGGYAHLYLNGLYWGMYYVHERPDHAWAAQIFGGDEDEYDAIKHSASGVINHSTGANATANYNAMLSAANAVAANPTDVARYATLCERLDVDDFISYLLANWFCGNHDWPSKNWYATHRNGPDGKWRFHSWDAEHTLEGTNSVGESPSGLHDKLAQSPEYRLRFADLVYRAFYHGGPLSYPEAANRFKARMHQIDRAIVGESARWGDNRQSRPYTRQDWLNTQNDRLASFFPNRSDQVLGWLRNAGLYPDVDAPDFVVDGLRQHGGHVASGAAILMSASAGTIWYTLDGRDPREPSLASGPTSELVLVPETAAKRALVPTGPLGNTWKSDAGFDDSDWIGGAGGIGYERSSGYEPFFAIDVESRMYGRNTTCFIRIPFVLSAGDVANAGALRLKVRYDDGFVAYLNGVEIQRALFNGTPSWNSTASGTHSDIDAIEYETFDLTPHLGALRQGGNLLAIQGLNESTTSSDFLISVELVMTEGAGSSTPTGVSSTAFRYVAPVTLGGSAQVKARVLRGSTWSALHEATFAVGPVAERLRISEIMYHPIETGQPGDPNTEYIELTNVGAETINLNFVRFIDGIDFTFPNVELAPADNVLVVKDVDAFEARYGGGFNVAGQYAGSLSNGGERIALSDAAGQVIADFRFEDDWYDLTDGLGYSLTVSDPFATDPSALSSKDAWRASAHAGGSPGFAEENR
ncbi:MAG: CotH kinase family protein [Sedimentisphaerales bacterium]|nr:CotH kinase family protein [Sedimentisphaerales bacterium]